LRRRTDNDQIAGVEFSAPALLVCLIVWSAAAPAAAGVQPEVQDGGRLHEHSEPIVLAPGYADLSFIPPAAGSYRLPPLGGAADGKVLDTAGREHRLHELFGDRLVVLSFIYTTCGDVNGCPLATHVFGKVADALVAAADLSGEVRLLSLSFDPEQDTSTVMRAYAERYRREGADWRFLTTASIADLDPLLDTYDQWVVRDYDQAGNSLGTMSHVLRVYLIDRQQKIRNIYSVSFLHADTIVNDVRTLLLEERQSGAESSGGG